MKAMISRLFSTRDRAAAPSGHSAVSSELTTSDIENYYLKIVADGMRRMLVPLNHIQLRIRRSGYGPTGLVAFAGYVRILKWDAVLTPVLLQNMPVIDARVRKVVRASVILEGTHFAGLWFQAGSNVQGAPTELLGMPCELIHQPGGRPQA